MQSTIRQTVFQVQPMKNIVGVGNTAAFQIIVSPGATLGDLGSVHVPAQAEVLNDSEFVRNTANGPGRGKFTSWFRSALATLHS
jgi:hypothetical protein